MPVCKNITGGDHFISKRKMFHYVTGITKTH